MATGSSASISAISCGGGGGGRAASELELRLRRGGEISFTSGSLLARRLKNSILRRVEDIDASVASPLPPSTLPRPSTVNASLKVFS